MKPWVYGPVEEFGAPLTGRTLTGVEVLALVRHWMRNRELARWN